MLRKDRATYWPYLTPVETARVREIDAKLAARHPDRRELSATRRTIVDRANSRRKYEKVRKYGVGGPRAAEPSYLEHLAPFERARLADIDAKLAEVKAQQHQLSLARKVIVNRACCRLIYRRKAAA